MTNKVMDELSWEEAVSRYLADHPDFFARHPAVLAVIDVPHAVRHGMPGQTVSLIERQVQVLRNRNLALERQLRDLLEIARQNDVIGERLHRFAVAMTDAGSLEDVIGTAQDLLRQEFRLDAVNVLLQDERNPYGHGPEFVRLDDARFQALLRRCEGRRVFCGGRLDAEDMEYLFNTRATDVQSLALVPIKDALRTGILALGSRDARRFHPEMGVIFLARLGELFMRAAARHLDNAA